MKFIIEDIEKLECDFINFMEERLLKNCPELTIKQNEIVLNGIHMFLCKTENDRKLIKEFK